MRVLHVTPYFAPATCYGGPPRSILSLCLGLKRLGVGVSVLTTSANGVAELPKTLVQAGAYRGVDVRYLARCFPKRYFFVRELSRHFLEQACRSDLVHVHGCWNFVNSRCMQECRRHRLPFVVSPRGMLDGVSFKRSRLKKTLAYRLTERQNLQGAAAICVSTAEERDRVERLKLERPIEVVPNAVDVTEFSRLPDRRAARQQLGYTDDETVVLYVGRLHPQKGVELLTDAVARVTNGKARCRLLIVGSGETNYVASLRARCASLVANRAVVFAGHLTGVRRLATFAAADVFATASECESFGMSIAEAMAARLPVVASKQCPWPEMESRDAGLLVERTAAAFAEALDSLCGDVAHRKRMGANGRRLVAAWDLATVGGMTRDMYQRTLAPLDIRTGAAA